VTQHVYIVAPHLLWAKRWADEQFRKGTLDRRSTFYSVKAGALADAAPDDLIVLVNPVMCTGERWRLVKDALELRRSGLVLVKGASTEVPFRFVQRMQANPRYIPFEVKT
jgi:hypothetical protein